MVYPAQTTCMYLLQMGDDRLEDLLVSFCTLTLDRKFDLLQAGEWFGITTHVTKIYEKHPHLKQPIHRLQGGLDHSNTASWIGNCLVRNVDIEGCWMKGRFKCAQMPFQSIMFT